MSVEELLKPRVKFILPYPGSENSLKEDQILDWSDERQGFVNGKLITILKETAKKFPYIFKPVEWWEERRPEDMPEYVKFSEDYRPYKEGQIYKVGFFEKEIVFIKVNKSNYKVNIDWAKLLPSTLAEYNEYKNQSNRDKK